MRALFLAAILLAAPSSAHAQGKSEARRLYESANAHFAVGEFAQAAPEYEAAFKLKNDAALLYNAAQSHRLSGNAEKALILYRNYLILFPKEVNAEQVREQLVKLKQALASSESARTNPPTSTVEPGPLRAEPGQEHTLSTPTTAAVTMPTTVTTKKPIYKQWWLWTVVGVVVAGGVVTAAVLATRPHSSWSNLPDVGPATGALTRW